MNIDTWFKCYMWLVVSGVFESGEVALITDLMHNKCNVLKTCKNSFMYNGEVPKRRVGVVPTCYPSEK